ncbi:MAG: hypothetical protein NUV77_08575, partial [Thermoguttaceae bacterium]|nr:hypothetical protein [Thermoguttaceae bacterium]
EEFCREPYHPVAGDLTNYRITDLRYHRDLTGGAYLDLTMVDPAGECIRLRFKNPSGIQMRGCLPSLVGPEVRNVSGRGWDGVSVVARCACCSEGSFSFWAEEVVALPNGT